MLREDERPNDAEQREDITKDARYSVAQVAGGTGGVGWMDGVDVSGPDSGRMEINHAIWDRNPVSGGCSGCVVG